MPSRVTATLAVSKSTAWNVPATVMTAPGSAPVTVVPTAGVVMASRGGNGVVPPPMPPPSPVGAILSNVDSSGFPCTASLVVIAAASAVVLGDEHGPGVPADHAV